jgi:hypothetical protein
MPAPEGRRSAKGEQKFGALFTTNGATTGQFNQCVCDQKNISSLALSTLTAGRHAQLSVMVSTV